MVEFELVLPAYNEAKSLPDLLARVAAAGSSCGLSPSDCQVIIVNNGSSDESAEVLAKLQAGPLGVWFRIVHVPVNQGYGYGVQSGLAATKAPFVGWSHSDLQCDPAEAFRAFLLLRPSPDLKLAQPPQLVKGSRFGRSFSSRVISGVFALAAGLSLGLWCGEINAQPKVFPRSLLDHLRGGPKDFSFDLFALYRARRAGFTFRTLRVHFPSRLHGLSNWSATFRSRRRTIIAALRYCLHLARSEGRL